MINTMSISPITLFVYNRPRHLKQTIEALKKNKLARESELFIFSDGPKDERDRKKVEEVRKYTKTIDGFKTITIIERKKNLGLAESIISGVTEIVNKYGTIIVLEDDLLTSPYFLKFMNEGLNLYENDEDVISIHSYIYPVKKLLPETYFLKGADCQGWATWKRGWDLFEFDGQKLLEELQSRKLTKEFDFSGSYTYTQMLRDQIEGKNNSWAVRWYASAFLKNKFTLYPKESLIYNTGFDASGINCGSEDNFNKTDKMESIKIEVKRIGIKENNEARLAVIDYFKSQTNLWVRGLRCLRRVLKYVFEN